MTKRRIATEKRRWWTADELHTLRELYANTPTAAIAKQLNRGISGTYGMAMKLGLAKSDAYFRANLVACGRNAAERGTATRFPKGHVPANKGLRRPGYAPGRMRDTQFKSGGFPANRDPDFYVLGALRVNADGYIDMRVSFEPGAKGWRALHRILWEDAHGPIPKGHVVTFKDRDKLNVELDNLELLSLADNCRRNSIHNLPLELRSTINALGALKRKINRHEKQDRGSAQPPVRDARGASR